MRFSMHPQCVVMVLAWTVAFAAARAHAVEGRALSVRDASGPIEGAAVRWPGGEALSDAAGVALLPDGVVPSCATSVGHVPVLLDAVTESRQSILLTRATSLRGRALSADGKPVEGLKLRPEGDDGLGPCARSATSDAKGGWTLHGLRAHGAGEILVEAPTGWVSAQDSLRASPRMPSLDVRLHAAVVPVVTVVDSAGAPLPGASVRIETDPADMRLDPGLGVRSGRACSASSSSRRAA